MTQKVKPPPEDIFTIERILFHFGFGVKNSKEKRRLYFVKWEGYPLTEGSWQDYSSLPKETVRKYLDVNEDSIFDFNEEIKNYTLDGENDRPFIPHFNPVAVVFGRERYNFASKQKEMMYLVSYQFLRMKLWEGKDLETIQKLIKEYEAKPTGKKRKRSNFEEDSDEEFEDNSDLYLFQDEEKEFEEPPAKFVKTGKKKRKAKRKTKRKAVGAPKMEKKKKKKKAPPKYEVSKMILDKKKRSIRFHGVTKSRGGDSDEFNLSISQMKKKDPSLTLELLENGIFDVMDDLKVEEVIEIDYD